VSAPEHKPGWIRVFCSVLAAFFGVQSQRNQLRDFTSGRYWPYVLAAVLLAAIFIVLVYLLVRLVLAYLI